MSLDASNLTTADKPGLAPLLAMATVVLSVFLLTNYKGPISLDNQLLALSVGIGAMAPAILFWQKGHDNDMPFFELLCCFFSFSMGWSAMSKDLGWPPFIAQEIISAAYGITWLALIGLACGFYFLRPSKGLTFKTMPLPGPVPAGFLPAFAIGLMTIGVVTFFLPTSWKEGWIEQVRGTCAGCGLAGAWLASYRGDVTQSQRLSIWVLTAALLLIQALIASMKPLIVVLITIGLVYVRAYRRIPFAMIAVTVIGVAMLNPVKYYWRAQLQEIRATGGNVSVAENLQILGDSIKDYYFGDNTLQIGSSEMTWNRFSDIALLTNTVLLTPKYIPYWEGESLKALPYSLVPRALLPGKPLPHYGNQFGRRYGIIGEHDGVTLVSINWITELFINFGEFGVFIGCLIIGFIMRLFQETFGASKVTDLQFAIGIGAAGMLYNGSENLSVVWGGLILKIVMMIALAHFSYTVLYPASQRRKSRISAQPDRKLTI